MLPETINTSECEKPLGVNLPCVPVEEEQRKRLTF